MSAPRRLAVAFAALALLAGASALARACGQCAEDKIAATFDAAVRARAARLGHVVVYTEVRGPAVGAPPSLREFIRRAVAATPGVDPGSVRVSLEPPAAAFACDPRTHAPARVIAAANPRLAARRLSLAVIKVDDGRRVGLAPPRGTTAAVRRGGAATSTASARIAAPRTNGTRIALAR